MRLEFQDVIDRYLLNQMSEDERMAFEEKCASNSELHEQLEHTRNVKCIVSDRSKMLEKFRQWDDEYEEEKKVSAHKKRVSLYWASGAAAAVVVGCFLFPAVNNSELGSMGNGSLNQETAQLGGHVIGSNDTLNRTEETTNRLLAKNDIMGGEGNNDFQIREEQLLYFGKDTIKTHKSDRKEELEEELKGIETEINKISEKMRGLRQQLNSEGISQEVYMSMVDLFGYQKDELNWRRLQILLNLNQRNEAMALLDKMRHNEGQYKTKADSLYKATLNHE